MEPPREDDKPEEDTTGHGLDGQLHDLIAVGEIESALSTSISSNNGDTSLGIRLPLLLRWLTAAQPLASPSPSLDDSTSTVLVASPNAVVPLLEDAAAAHHDAENIEVLVSSLAPAICKEVIGKLPPISRKKPDNEFISRRSLAQKHQPSGGDVWDTKSLDKAIHRLLKQEQKRKRESNQTSMSNNKKQKTSSNDEYLEKMKTVIEVLEKDLENEDDEEIVIEKDVANGGDDTISSFVERASDDSYVSSIRRVLHELLLLVQNSLTTDKDGGMTSNTDDRDSTLHDTQKLPWVSIKPDYLLAQTDTTTSSSGMGGFGLPVMLSALMHHAPILRYRHVSSALCRASIPQTSTLILHMAANCPAASSCLLRGCVDAYEDARKYQSLVKQSQLAEEMDLGEKAINIIHSSIASVKELASLSRREAYNVVRVLRECDNNVMPSLVLKILLDTDEDEAAAFVIETLSSSLIKPPNTSQTIDSGVSPKKRSLPLNQRIIRSKQIHNQSKIDRGKAPEQNSSPIEDLLEDPATTQAALRCFSRTIIQLSRTAEEQFCTGKTSLYTKAYGVLTYFITIISQSSSNYGTIIEDTIYAIHSLSKFITNRSPDTGPDEESMMDEIYSLLLCTVLFTIAHVSTSSTTSQTAEKDCLACLESLLLHPVSMKTTIFASQMCRYLIDNNTNELLKLSLQSISGKYASWDEEINKDLDICQWISSKIGSELLELVHDKATSIEYVLYDASIFIVKMKISDLEQSSEFEQMIRTILDDPGRCCKLIKQSTVCDLISQSAKFTCRKRAPHIPIVLPLALERCSRKIWADIGAGKDVASNFTQFVLQLLYALCFLEEDPKSPFVINPRSFPLRESLIFVDQLQQTITATEHAGVSILYKTLKEYILHHCPDVIQTTERYAWLDQKHERFVVPHQTHFVTPNMVHDAINDCFRQSTDPSGVRAEKLFNASRAANPSASVDIAAVSAILASKRSQPKFVSYVTLCKDPLLLLQARAAVWKCKGLRRIMIRVLCDLMTANESITRKDSASPMAALQYLTARDAVILKCVLFACASASLLRSNSENTSMHCAMCVSLMRSIASSRRGVITILVKEGLPQSSIDFLAQFIPESFLDASELISLLSEKETISLVERLATASAALSICAANSSRGEATAKNLLSASLDTLIDGFFLVIGPVGLPVSVFRDENNGQDITLMCKEVTFQMIKTLSTINPRSSLKKDACMYLSKIAAMCKSENAVGGVSGAVAAKRKSLLKEIYDSCDSSYRCLGGSLS